MGSRTFEGVRFSAWSQDHDPLHMHGFYAGVELVVELNKETRQASASPRKKNPRPRDAKKSDVAYILLTASKYFDELLALRRKS